MVAGDEAYWRQGRALYERMLGIAAEVHEYADYYQDSIWQGAAADIADAIHVLQLHRPQLGGEGRQ